MGRLIDADKLKQHYSWWGGLIGDDFVSELVEQKKVFDTIVDVQPTVDAERHGHWDTEVRTDFLGKKHCYYACSVCGRAQDDETPFCALCGAKMDEVIT